MIYKLWAEPKAPDFVLEVASENTWKQDEGPKRALYAELGIREYWMFDPRDEYFDPPLQGLTLQDGAYRPLPARVEGGRRVFRSEALELDLRVQGGRLWFRDPATGQDLRTLRDERAVLREERARAQGVAARGRGAYRRTGSSPARAGVRRAGLTQARPRIRRPLPAPGPPARA